MIITKGEKKGKIKKYRNKTNMIQRYRGESEGRGVIKETSARWRSGERK